MAANRVGLGGGALAGGRGRGRGLAGRGLPVGGRGRGRGLAASGAPVPGALGRGRGRGRGRGSLAVGNISAEQKAAPVGRGRGRGVPVGGGGGRGSALERKSDDGESPNGVSGAASADAAVAKSENFLTTASFVFILPLLKYAVANGVPKSTFTLVASFSCSYLIRLCTYTLFSDWCFKIRSPPC